MLRERCFLVDDLLTVVFKRLAERCFSSVLTVILIKLQERYFVLMF